MLRNTLVTRALFTVVSLFATEAVLATPFSITDATARGQCQPQIFVEQDADGGYVLSADFDDLVASADGTTTTREFRHCTLTYNINLAPGYIVRRIDSAVQGNYSVGIQGKAIVRMENRPVGSLFAVSSLLSFNQPTAGDTLLENFVGSISRAQLPAAAQAPGASFGLNTKYSVEAVQLQPGLTDVRLISANTSASGYPICKIFIGQQSM